MNLRTYQAYTMAEALAAAKKDLGPQAVILHTRTFRRGGFLGLGASTIVELTAGVDPRPAPVAEAKPTSITQSAARRAYHRAVDVPAKSAPELLPTSDADRTRRLAMLLAESHSRAAAPPPAPTAAPSRRAVHPSPAQHPLAAAPASPVPPAPGSSAPSVARRFILQPPVTAPEPPAADRPEWPTTPIAPPSKLTGSGAELDRMRDELSAIRGMVSRVLEQQDRDKQPAIPPGTLFDTYLNLIAQDLAEEIAVDVVHQVQRRLSATDLADAELVRQTAIQCLQALIPAGGESFIGRSPDDRPLTLAMIGPTGVGKTTTLAKLAAACKLKFGKRVGLVTADTYRIAAVEQLRTYADILGVPLRVAATPAEMQQACASLSECDVILIDTAGRSQKDTAALSDLRQLLEAADPHEVHLVLSSTSGEKALLNEAREFSAVRVDRIALTKLDEAVSFGTLVNVMQNVGKSLSYITTGQEVPDHLEVARPQRLAAILLGGAVRT